MTPLRILTYSTIIEFVLLIFLLLISKFKHKISNKYKQIKEKLKEKREKRKERREKRRAEKKRLKEEKKAKKEEEKKEKEETKQKLKQVRIKVINSAEKNNKFFWTTLWALIVATFVPILYLTLKEKGLLQQGINYYFNLFSAIPKLYLILIGPSLLLIILAVLAGLSLRKRKIIWYSIFLTTIVLFLSEFTWNYKKDLFINSPLWITILAMFFGILLAYILVKIIEFLYKKISKIKLKKKKTSEY